MQLSDAPQPNLFITPEEWRTSVCVWVCFPEGHDDGLWLSDLTPIKPTHNSKTLPPGSSFCSRNLFMCIIMNLFKLCGGKNRVVIQG